MLVSWALVEEADATTSIVGIVQRQATEESPAGQLGLADEIAACHISLRPSSWRISMIARS